ncbi:DD3-3 [Symbiodinium sp. CCMP2592]|nr:DD3-3 [Symbiodinium sp. CCMP2592]
MAGTWGSGSDSPPDVWGSFCTVLHTDYSELEPLLDRVDLDDLVALRRTIHRCVEHQVEKQFVEAQTEAENAATSSTSGAAPQVAPPGAPGAKSPTTGPPPQLVVPVTMSVAAKQFAKADPPPLKANPPPLSKKGTGKTAAKTGSPPAKATEPSSSSSSSQPKPVQVKATPAQVQQMFAGNVQPATAEDAIAMMQAADAATKVAEVPVVDLNTMDDDLADPPMPPPVQSPPTKAMPQVAKATATTTPGTTTPSSAPAPAADDSVGAASSSQPTQGNNTDGPQAHGSQDAPPPTSTFPSGSQTQRGRRPAPRPAVDPPNLEAALSFGPPGPIMATQFLLAEGLSAEEPGRAYIRSPGYELPQPQSARNQSLGYSTVQGGSMWQTRAVSAVSSRAVMFHVTCPHERTSFASLVHVLGSLDLHSALEPLRARGVKSASDLENTPKTQLRQWIGDQAVDKLFNRSVVRSRSRADAPVVHPYQRGSRSLAASVQSESALASADAAFQEDKFAKTSRGPRESRWKLWCSLAEQRNLPPLPVTVELIDKIGALFKQARYRSAAQYYSVAKGEHRSQGHDWSPALDHAVAQAVRSITRGKFDSDIEAAYARLQVPSAARIEYPSDTGIVAAWFLLRGCGRSGDEALLFTPLQQCDLHEWPRQVLQRWAQHAFRVAGAQLFARADLDLHVIMLLGRWGSAAIYRYVQVRRPRDQASWRYCRQLSTRSAAMAATATFDELCDKAAVHPTVRLLFKARGVDVPGVIHHLFSDRSKIQALLDPLRTGVELAGDTKKRSADELLIDQATVLELLDVIAATKTAASPAAPAAPAASTTSTSSSDRSQELPASYWNDFVTEYETAVVDGRNRKFPAHLLVGSEKTLGRMVAEKKSGLYTALALGEILFSRHFTASKQVNPFSSTTKPETSKLFASEDGTLSKACKFAFMFARWGPNPEVADYFAFWEDLTRDNPSKFGQIRLYWKKASWEMAMALRSGKTFAQAAAEVTSPQAKQDAMSRWVPPDRPFKGNEKGGEKGKKGDKGTGKGKTGRPSPYWQQQAPQSAGWGQQQSGQPRQQWERSPASVRLGTARYMPRSNRSLSSNVPPVDNTVALLILHRPAPHHLIHNNLDSRPVLSWSWELDPEAIKVASSQHPEMIHHGDVFGRKPQEVLAALSASVPKDTVVLLFAAPPCHDFSRIRSDPPGTQGQKGSKFVRFAEWLKDFAKSSSFRVLFLVENVYMSASQQQELDRALECRAFACDAANWGIVSRPRLWWSNVVSPPPENVREPPVVLGGQSRWRRLNRHWEMSQARQTYPTLQPVSGYRVARLLVLLVLCQAGVIDAHPVRVEEWYPNVPDPCFQIRWHPDGSRPLQRVASWWRRSTLQWDPNETQPDELRPPGSGSAAHFLWAQKLTFADVFPAPLNPCLAWTFHVQARLGLKVVQVRQSVLQDLQDLVAELQEDQDEALQALPAHVAAVYKQGSPQLRFQLLPLAWLLDLCQFPGRSELLTELFWGFRLLGPVVRGSGWLNRDDAKYSRPLAKQDFVVANRQLALAWRQPSAQPEHHDAMIAELEKERELGAYRSLPVREPTECGLVMPGVSPSLWSHNALPFGSVGSVWAYLRVADVVSFLTITLLLMFAAHYVDDFFSLERSRTALSGFAVFQAFHRVLGFRMKEEKSKEPRFEQTLLGIEWTITAEALFASPGAAGMTQSLHQLRNLLPRLQPRRFAISQHERNKPVAHLFADAFLTVHGVRRVANKWLSELPPLQELSSATNGFGSIVALPGRRPLGFRGEVPASVLAGLAASRAYIFWLEALAQLVSLAVVCDLVDTHVCCWIDNTAAEHALNKGYSKDLRLSAIIGAFWVWAASRSLSVSFHRVSSEENISDGISRGDLGDLQAANGDFYEVSFKEVWPLLEHFRDDCRRYQDEFAQVVALLVAASLRPSSPPSGFPGFHLMFVKRSVHVTRFGEFGCNKREELLTTGEAGKHMYFLQTGTLNYKQENEPEYRTKAEQLWLVEAALWLKWIHVGTAESLTHCELLGLDVGKVQDVLKDEATVATYARKFWRYFSENPGLLSDVWMGDPDDEESPHHWAASAFSRAEEIMGRSIQPEPLSPVFTRFLDRLRRASNGMLRRFSVASIDVDDAGPAVAGPGKLPPQLQALVDRMQLQRQEEAASDSDSESGLGDDSEGEAPPPPVVAKTNRNASICAVVPAPPAPPNSIPSPTR